MKNRSLWRDVVKRTIPDFKKRNIFFFLLFFILQSLPIWNHFPEQHLLYTVCLCLFSSCRAFPCLAKPSWLRMEQIRSSSRKAKPGLSEVLWTRKIASMSSTSGKSKMHKDHSAKLLSHPLSYQLNSHGNCIYFRRKLDYFWIALVILQA